MALILQRTKLYLLLIYLFSISFSFGDEEDLVNDNSSNDVVKIEFHWADRFPVSYTISRKKDGVLLSVFRLGPQGTEALEWRVFYPKKYSTGAVLSERARQNIVGVFDDKFEEKSGLDGLTVTLEIVRLGKIERKNTWVSKKDLRFEKLIEIFNDLEDASGIGPIKRFYWSAEKGKDQGKAKESVRKAEGVSP